MSDWKASYALRALKDKLEQYKLPCIECDGVGGIYINALTWTLCDQCRGEKYIGNAYQYLINLLDSARL